MKPAVKQRVGGFLFFVGILLGFAVGISTFLGGVRSMVNGFSAAPFDAWAVALGALAVVLASPLGMFTFFVMTTIAVVVSE